MISISEIKNGLHYFLIGWGLITKKGIKRFVIMPLIVNVMLLGGLFWLLLHTISSMITTLTSWLPDWLAFLGSILLFLAILMILLFYYFIFTALSGFIAAPFNAILAEKVETMLTRQQMAEMPLSAMLRDIPRMLQREWQKLIYSLPRLLILFLLGFIPLIGQTAVPILAFLFMAWLLAIQYCDYPFDNHKIPFHTMRNVLSHRRDLSLTFGVLVALCSFIPFINLLIMPVAVCGATAMWVDIYRVHLEENNEPIYQRLDSTK